MVNYISSNTGTGIDTAVDRVQAVSGDLVGTSDTQTLNNKTFTDTLTIDQNNNNVGLNIDHDGTSGRAINTTNAVEGNTYHLFEGTGGAGAKINLMRASGNVTAGDALFYVEHQGSSTTIPAQRITNAGTGYGLYIDQNGNGIPLYTDNAGNVDGIYLNQSGVLSGNRYGIQAYSNAIQTTNGALLGVRMDNASSSSNAAFIQNDGTGNALFIQQNNQSRAVDIRSTATNIGMLQVYSNSVHTGTAADAIANFRQDNASATGTVVYVQNDGSGASLDINGGSIVMKQQTATGDGTTTVDWDKGNIVDFTFGAANEVFTFTAPTRSGTFIIKLKQDATGSRTATWPASVKWVGGAAPTLSTAGASEDIITFYYDGTSYYGISSLDFS